VSINTPSSAPAGWFLDPHDSSALRWWDGTQWTAHTTARPQQPVAAPNPAAAPVAPVSPYAMAPVTTPQFAAAAHPSMPYRPPAAPISNTAAWLSLGFGAIAMVLASLRFTVGSGSFIFTTTGIAAIAWGVRGIVRLRSGASNNKWAPVTGIALGSIATVLMVIGLAGFVHVPTPYQPQVQQQAPQSATPPAGSAEVFGSEKVLASSLAASIEYRFNDNGRLLKPGHRWPSELVTDAKSELADDHGVVVFNQPAGFTLTYTLVDDTSFTVKVRSAAMDVSVVYLSATDSFEEFCGVTECTPASGTTGDSGSTT